MEDNGCITTVPEWRKVGHEWRTCERRWSLPSFTCCVQEDEREAERKIHVRECVEDMSVWDRHIPYKFQTTFM